MKGDIQRTESDTKYRPVENHRFCSRYGMIEKALNQLKVEMDQRSTKGFKSADVANRVKQLETMTVANILRFTKGVKRDSKCRSWEFTGEPIRVENE